ncbi:MAG: cation:proton antiporter subunit C [Pseudomonadota bacterium]
MQLVNLNYSFSILLFCLGLYVVFSSNNSIKKLLGLSLFQTSVLWFYISIAKVAKAQPPILKCLLVENCPSLYSNPLPHVLMLTAIVVGAATVSLGYALIINFENEN